MRYLITILLLLVFVLPVAAQSGQRTEVPAADGLALVGDWYAPAEVSADGNPAVLLMHMYGVDRQTYEPLIPALVEGGYFVMNVDLRGHGETGGREDWEAALTDVQTWLDWIREQDGVRDEAVAIIGASIGANLALIGCAADEQCATAIALSPGLDYFNVAPSDAFANGLTEKSALLVASYGDNYSASSVKQFLAIARGDVAVRLYTGRDHGTEYFNEHLESLTTFVIAWLDEHTALKN